MGKAVKLNGEGKTSVRGVRLDDGLWKKLEEAAKGAKRKLNNYISVELESVIEKLKDKR